jgi:hypothetical protein
MLHKSGLGTILSTHAAFPSVSAFNAYYKGSLPAADRVELFAQPVIKGFRFSGWSLYLAFRRRETNPYAYAIGNLVGSCRPKAIYASTSMDPLWAKVFHRSTAITEPGYRYKIEAEVAGGEPVSLMVEAYELMGDQKVYSYGCTFEAQSFLTPVDPYDSVVQEALRVCAILDAQDRAIPGAEGLTAPLSVAGRDLEWITKPRNTP